MLGEYRGTHPSELSKKLLFPLARCLDNTDLNKTPRGILFDESLGYLPAHFAWIAHFDGNESPLSRVLQELGCGRPGNPKFGGYFCLTQLGFVVELCRS
ncbi:hypothetical protein GCM10027031_19300 [Corynebacterium atrinae]